MKEKAIIRDSGGHRSGVTCSEEHIHAVLEKQPIITPAKSVSGIRLVLNHTKQMAANGSSSTLAGRCRRVHLSGTLNQQ
jgi:hypothetical protein